ncbi:MULTISPECIES: DegT/DnrJ/EryC1/StrS family aminotransferase [Halomonadaceae]|uniref:DegT/DnrJ/EryC1/StrS family aminotransferase n=1 Tax=Billgrantia aerodenitrificans TaxID=2733483 RepID=A0ABS9AWA9_9GAMM|nr:MULTISPECIES: DegT/DnrJ/EryC1/StrS family aminotransferase [Halomonas]MCE8025897.1 DegT/DnrJ/EryC1/StrS family aminotransferase [Halomonas aerodenitrificans]
MIPVTRPYLPARARLERYLDSIYNSHCLTNNGPLTQQLGERLAEYLDVEHLLLVGNGTLALQIAYRALGVSGPTAEEGWNAVTTPFSFVATTSSLKWDGGKPAFADIDPDTWCVDAHRVVEAISPCSRALVPVHVFGNACNVEHLEAIAARNGLPVIYDGAHAFGVRYKGKSLLRRGDATTLSFHATKIFHCIEGGAIIFRCREDLETARLMTQFGTLQRDRIDAVGINAKLNEFQAAMGLCILDEIDTVLTQRADIWERYRTQLTDWVRLQVWNPKATQNHAYFPIVFESEAVLLQVLTALGARGIEARRYFYPSLDDVACLSPAQVHHKGKQQSNAQSLASRILCLPIYPGLTSQQVDVICETVKESLGHVGIAFGMPGCTKGEDQCRTKPSPN